MHIVQEEKIERLEELAKASPGTFRFRVGLLALIGYMYVYLLLALSAGLFVVAITNMLDGGFTFGTIKLSFITGVLAIILVRAVWIKIPMPNGRMITKSEAPELFAEVEELTAALNTPKIDRIIIDHDYNASMAQIPRFGILGGYQNVLIIGLPLLLTMSKEQVRAVISHELGHLKGGDSKFGSWIYRSQMSWYRTMEQMDEKDLISKLFFNWFFKWYLPVLETYSFILIRQQEYLADEAAVSMTSSKVYGKTLTELAIKAPFFYSEFWEQLSAFSKSHDNPAPYRHLLEYYSRFPQEQKQAALQKALEEKTNYEDTHPSLSDRLQAIGEQPFVGEHVEALAVQAYFQNPDGIIREFDDSWWSEVGEDWEERYEENEQAKTYFDSLNEKEELTPMEKLEKVNLTRRFEGIDAAFPLYETLKEKHPELLDDAAFLFSYGTACLDKDIEEGIMYLKKAAKLDWEIRLEALEAIGDYYYERERFDELEPIAVQREEWLSVLEEAEEETLTADEGDHFIRHDLPDETVEVIKEALTDVPHIKRAFLVRKVLKTIPERPCYVIIVSMDKFKFGKSEKMSNDILARLEHVTESVNDLTVAVSMEIDPVFEEIENIAGARLR